MSILTRNNVRLLGNQQADKTLVFAHGFGTDQTAWSEVAPAFFDDCRVVLFDYVGANEKTVPFFNVKKYRQLYSYADDILDIFEELDLKDVIFVGHSAGGMSGTLAALQEPTWFSRLVLLNSSPCYVNEENYVGGFSTESLDDLFAQMESNFHAWASGFAPMVMANADRPQFASAFAKTLSAMRPDVALAIAKVIFYSDHRTDITRLPHQTLLVQGKVDIAVPVDVSYYMEKHMPNAILTFINTEGHLPHISGAQEVIQAIKPFVN
ncbi:alpha/beta hydrolase [Spirosoma aureum]|uniref:Alpha/beta hydrolase n=1 Tax=Spirosoma aureum TaxID=2692134 RepID=A0A6G9AXR9_9BACT|nr:alpha/beta hydrolase [Spirosoma aureum]QIP17129.1 alpha/beta hydrolase [Spirosoma aureum]